MVQEYQAGADIVLMERSSREDNGPIKRLFSKWFYKVINALSTFKFHPNSTDFFLLSRPVADILKENFRERNRFIRGFIQNLGFDKRILEFEAPAREHGESSYSYYALIKLAFNAIFSFSNKPLRLIILVAVLFVLFTILVGGYSLYMYISGDSPPSGYTTIILFLSASFSILFVLLTIFFLYFEKSIQETRQRPIYLIKKKK